MFNPFKPSTAGQLQVPRGLPRAGSQQQGFVRNEQRSEQTLQSEEQRVAPGNAGRAPRVALQCPPWAGSAHGGCHRAEERTAEHDNMENPLSPASPSVLTAVSDFGGFGPLFLRLGLPGSPCPACSPGEGWMLRSEPSQNTHRASTQQPGLPRPINVTEEFTLWQEVTKRIFYEENRK